MTDRQALLDRTARRLLTIGYAVYRQSAIHKALLAEGWTHTSDTAFRRILGDVQRTARDIYTASLPKVWS